MASGMEMMVNALVKAIGLNPEDIVKQAHEIGSTVIALKAQLDRIEHKLDALHVSRLTAEIDLEAEQLERDINGTE